MSHLLLSLEPEDSPIAQDISPDGVEVYEVPSTRSQKLARNLERIRLQKTLNAGNDEANETKNSKEEPPKVYPTVQIIRAVEQARFEMNLLNQTVERFVFGTRGPYPSRPYTDDASQLTMIRADGRKGPRLERQIEELQTVLGAKDNALRQVSDTLNKSAEKIQNLLKSEHSFFEEYVPNMRRAGWFLQTRLRARASFEGGGVAPTPIREYYVDYGYNAAGSTFESCEAFVMRRLDGGEDQEVRLELKHKKTRRMVASIIGQSQTRTSKFVKTDVTIPQTVPMQLLAAQSTAFEIELFKRILSDIASDPYLSRQARIASKSVSLPISDTKTLRFELVNEATYQPPPDSITDYDVTLIELLARQGLRAIHRERRSHLERIALTGSTATPKKAKINMILSILRAVSAQESFLPLHRVLTKTFEPIATRIPVTLTRAVSTDKHEWTVTLFDKWTITISKLIIPLQGYISNKSGSNQSNVSLKSTVSNATMDSIVDDSQLFDFLAREVRLACLDVISRQAQQITMSAENDGVWEWVEASAISRKLVRGGKSEWCVITGHGSTFSSTVFDVTIGRQLLSRITLISSDPNRLFMDDVSQTLLDLFI
ncbi:hypothetical protein SmJEL517_g05785 [Synchytrium microbalum]|uniref:Mediator of RNA polymerase II transcription subunit 17 n=1 Tax=Synchytrium microbalum TaxID=1806994 RepID=A0A507BUM8_9FUNG|nr:uncharacterized protein SmJEL517_g05785 [Synchytrium microbalum]TPX30699.1 hypothetical protein SmJEL517_g05785 [Synchytrium microbalum]